MRLLSFCGILVMLLLFACKPSETKTTSASPTSEGANQLGQFNIAQDVYLAHFDLKTDVDDIHSVAAVATMLADNRFSDVTYHAVTGTYGAQGGLYVPANHVFDMAFGSNWSDAHTDFDQALHEVIDLATTTLQEGGTVWIAEGGQSDFSAALVRDLQIHLPHVDLMERVRIVQHADWNEEVTTPADLAFVQEAALYHKIPDGNAVGNGTPGFAAMRQSHGKTTSLILG